MIYVWKLDKLIFPAWVSNICIKPWIGLQMFINCVCHNSVKPSKQASGRSFLGRDTIRAWRGGRRSTRRERVWREGRPRLCFMMADRYVVWSMGADSLCVCLLLFKLVGRRYATLSTFISCPRNWILISNRHFLSNWHLSTPNSKKSVLSVLKVHKQNLEYALG